MATTTIRDVLHTYDWSEAKMPTSLGKSSELPTIVFVHGWLLSRSYWQPVIDHVSKLYSCLHYDLRGFGESAATMSGDCYPEQGYTLGDYAEDLMLLLKKLNIKKVWVVGHSLGGRIALWAASKNFHVVEGVVWVVSG